MAKALWESSTEEAGKSRKPVDWKRRMSDHVAYALLVYTGLQIFVTMGALKSEHGSILPYFALVAAGRGDHSRAAGCSSGGGSACPEADAPREELRPLFMRDLAHSVGRARSACRSSSPASSR